MVLSQDTLAHPVKKNFPLKPKTDNSISEMKLLPKKPTTSDLIRTWSGMEDELNTPQMFDEFFAPEVEEEMLPDTEPFEDVWNLQNCVSQAEAEGKQSSPETVLFEAMVPNLDVKDPLSHLVSNEPFSFMLNSQEHDILEKSLLDTGLDFSSLYTDLTVAPVIPEPIPSTSMFMSEHLQPVEQESKPPVTLQTCGLLDVIAEPSISMDATDAPGQEFYIVGPSDTLDTNTMDLKFIPAASTFADVTTTYPSGLGFIPSTESNPNTSLVTDNASLPSTSQILTYTYTYVNPRPNANPNLNHTSTTDDESKDDPTWVPESLQDLYKGEAASTSKASVYAKKTKLHRIEKTSMSIKKKPGRPERQEPFVITEVPSKKCVSVSQEELEVLKYRRMRDLNNRASQLCRAKRRNKQAMLEEELQELENKNQKLQEKLATMEKEADYYRIANSKRQ